jgi:hypothetical protein
VWDTTKKAQDSERSAGEIVSPRVHASDVINKAPHDQEEDDGSILHLSEVCNAEGTCVTHHRIPTPMPRVSGGKGEGGGVGGRAQNDKTVPTNAPEACAVPIVFNKRCIFFVKTPVPAETL